MLGGKCIDISSAKLNTILVVRVTSELFADAISTAINQYIPAIAGNSSRVIPFQNNDVYYPGGLWIQDD
jgi:hypothetical protein